MPGGEDLGVSFPSRPIGKNFVLRRVPEIVVVKDSSGGRCVLARGCSRPPQQSSGKAVIGPAIVGLETVHGVTAPSSE